MAGFLIPVSPAPLPMARTFSSPVRRIGPILVVDDYDDARASVREALENSGYRVNEARNGQQALDLLVSRPEERPALIVLDLRMPIMTGWELLELMSCYIGLTSIPVIILTAQEPHLEQLRHPAIFAWFQAPYRLEELVEAVDACLAQARQPTVATTDSKGKAG